MFLDVCKKQNKQNTQTKKQKQRNKNKETKTKKHHIFKHPVQVESQAPFT